MPNTPEKRIVIDFDGTLVNEDETGKVFCFPGAADATQQLKDLGYSILISSCRITLAKKRGELDAEIAFIERTLERFGIVYDAIYLGDKPVADYYVDDRAIVFRGDWQRVVKRITS